MSRGQKQIASAVTALDTEVIPQNPAATSLLLSDGAPQSLFQLKTEFPGLVYRGEKAATPRVHSAMFSSGDPKLDKSWSLLADNLREKQRICLILGNSVYGENRPELFGYLAEAGKPADPKKLYETAITDLQDFLIAHIKKNLHLDTDQADFELLLKECEEPDIGFPYRSKTKIISTYLDRTSYGRAVLGCYVDALLSFEKTLSEKGPERIFAEELFSSLHPGYFSQGGEISEELSNWTMRLLGAFEENSGGKERNLVQLARQVGRILSYIEERSGEISDEFRGSLAGMVANLEEDALDRRELTELLKLHYDTIAKKAEVEQKLVTPISIIERIKTFAADRKSHHIAWLCRWIDATSEMIDSRLGDLKELLVNVSIFNQRKKKLELRLEQQQVGIILLNVKIQENEEKNKGSYGYLEQEKSAPLKSDLLILRKFLELERLSGHHIEFSLRLTSAYERVVSRGGLEDYFSPTEVSIIQARVNKNYEEARAWQSNRNIEAAIGFKYFQSIAAAEQGLFEKEWIELDESAAIYLGFKEGVKQASNYTSSVLNDLGFRFFAEQDSPTPKVLSYIGAQEEREREELKNVLATASSSLTSAQKSLEVFCQQSRKQSFFTGEINEVLHDNNGFKRDKLTYVTDFVLPGAADGLDLHIPQVGLTNDAAKLLEGPLRERLLLRTLPQPGSVANGTIPFLLDVSDFLLRDDDGKLHPLHSLCALNLLGDKAVENILVPEATARLLGHSNNDYFVLQPSGDLVLKHPEEVASRGVVWVSDFLVEVRQKKNQDPNSKEAGSQDADNDEQFVYDYISAETFFPRNKEVYTDNEAQLASKQELNSSCFALSPMSAEDIARTVQPNLKSQNSDNYYFALDSKEAKEKGLENNQPPMRCRSLPFSEQMIKETRELSSRIFRLHTQEHGTISCVALSKEAEELYRRKRREGFTPILLRIPSSIQVALHYNPPLTSNEDADPALFRGEYLVGLRGEYGSEIQAEDILWTARVASVGKEERFLVEDSNGVKRYLSQEHLRQFQEVRDDFELALKHLGKEDIVQSCEKLLGDFLPLQEMFVQGLTEGGRSQVYVDTLKSLSGSLVENWEKSRLSSRLEELKELRASIHQIPRGVHLDEFEEKLSLLELQLTSVIGLIEDNTIPKMAEVVKTLEPNTAEEWLKTEGVIFATTIFSATLAGASISTFGASGYLAIFLHSLYGSFGMYGGGEAAKIFVSRYRPYIASDIQMLLRDELSGDDYSSQMISQIAYGTVNAFFIVSAGNIVGRWANNRVLKSVESARRAEALGKMGQTIQRLGLDRIARKTELAVAERIVRAANQLKKVEDLFERLTPEARFRFLKLIRDGLVESQEEGWEGLGESLAASADSLGNKHAARALKLMVFTYTVLNCAKGPGLEYGGESRSSIIDVVKEKDLVILKLTFEGTKQSLERDLRKAGYVGLINEDAQGVIRIEQKEELTEENGGKKLITVVREFKPTNESNFMRIIRSAARNTDGSSPLENDFGLLLRADGSYTVDRLISSEGRHLQNYFKSLGLLVKQSRDGSSLIVTEVASGESICVRKGHENAPPGVDENRFTLGGEDLEFQYWNSLSQIQDLRVADLGTWGDFLKLKGAKVQIPPAGSFKIEVGQSEFFLEEKSDGSAVFCTIDGEVVSDAQLSGDALALHNELSRIAQNEKGANNWRDYLSARTPIKTKIKGNGENQVLEVAVNNGRAFLISKGENDQLLIKDAEGILFAQANLTDAEKRVVSELEVFFKNNKEVESWQQFLNRPAVKISNRPLRVAFFRNVFLIEQGFDGVPLIKDAKGNILTEDGFSQNSRAALTELLNRSKSAMHQWRDFAQSWANENKVQGSESNLCGKGILKVGFNGSQLEIRQGIDNQPVVVSSEPIDVDFNTISANRADAIKEVLEELRSSACSQLKLVDLLQKKKFCAKALADRQSVEISIGGRTFLFSSNSERRVSIQEVTPRALSLAEENALPAQQRQFIEQLRAFALTNPVEWATRQEKKFEELLEPVHQEFIRVLSLNQVSYEEIRDPINNRLIGFRYLPGDIGINRLARIKAEHGEELLSSPREMFNRQVNGLYDVKTRRFYVPLKSIANLRQAYPQIKVEDETERQERIKISTDQLHEEVHAEIARRSECLFSGFVAASDPQRLMWSEKRGGYDRFCGVDELPAYAVSIEAELEKLQEIVPPGSLPPAQVVTLLKSLGNSNLKLLRELTDNNIPLLRVLTRGDQELLHKLTTGRLELCKQLEQEEKKAQKLAVQLEKKKTELTGINSEISKIKRAIRRGVAPEGRKLERLQELERNLEAQITDLEKQIKKDEDSQGLSLNLALTNKEHRERAVHIKKIVDHAEILQGIASNTNHLCERVLAAVNNHDSQVTFSLRQGVNQKGLPEIVVFGEITIDNAVFVLNLGTRDSLLASRPNAEEQQRLEIIYINKVRALSDVAKKMAQKANALLLAPDKQRACSANPLEIELLKNQANDLVSLSQQGMKWSSVPQAVDDLSFVPNPSDVPKNPDILLPDSVGSLREGTTAKPPQLKPDVSTNPGRDSVLPEQNKVDLPENWQIDKVEVGQVSVPDESLHRSAEDSDIQMLIDKLRTCPAAEINEIVSKLKVKKKGAEPALPALFERFVAGAITDLQLILNTVEEIGCVREEDQQYVKSIVEKASDNPDAVSLYLMMVQSSAVDLSWVAGRSSRCISLNPQKFLNSSLPNILGNWLLQLSPEQREGFFGFLPEFLSSQIIEIRKANLTILQKIGEGLPKAEVRKLLLALRSELITVDEGKEISELINKQRPFFEKSEADILLNELTLSVLPDGKLLKTRYLAAVLHLLVHPIQYLNDPSDSADYGLLRLALSEQLELREEIISAIASDWAKSLPELIKRLDEDSENKSSNREILLLMVAASIMQMPTNSDGAFEALKVRGVTVLHECIQAEANQRAIKTPKFLMLLSSVPKAALPVLSEIVAVYNQTAHLFLVDSILRSIPHKDVVNVLEESLSRLDAMSGLKVAEKLLMIEPQNSNAINYAFETLNKAARQGQSLEDDCSELCQVALKLICSLKPEDSRLEAIRNDIIPILAKILSTKELQGSFAMAANCAALLRSDAESLLPDLLNHLNSPLVHQPVLIAIQKITKAIRAAKKPFSKEFINRISSFGQTASEVATKQTAQETLLSAHLKLLIGIDVENSLKAIMYFISDEDHNNIAMAVEAFAQSGSEVLKEEADNKLAAEICDKIVALAEDSSNPMVRDIALKALGSSYFIQNQAAFKILSKALKEVEPLQRVSFGAVIEQVKRGVALEEAALILPSLVCAAQNQQLLELYGDEFELTMKALTEKCSQTEQGRETIVKVAAQVAKLFDFQQSVLSPEEFEKGVPINTDILVYLGVSGLDQLKEVIEKVKNKEIIQLIRDRLSETHHEENKAKALIEHVNDILSKEGGELRRTTEDDAKRDTLANKSKEAQEKYRLCQIAIARNRGRDDTKHVYRQALRDLAGLYISNAELQSDIAASLLCELEKGSEIQLTMELLKSLKPTQEEFFVRLGESIKDSKICDERVGEIITFVSHLGNTSQSVLSDSSVIDALGHCFTSSRAQNICLKAEELLKLAPPGITLKYYYQALYSSNQSVVVRGVERILGPNVGLIPKEHLPKLFAIMAQPYAKQPKLPQEPSTSLASKICELLMSDKTELIEKPLKDDNLLNEELFRIAIRQETDGLASVCAFRLIGNKDAYINKIECALSEQGGGRGYKTRLARFLGEFGDKGAESLWKIQSSQDLSIRQAVVDGLLVAREKASPSVQNKIDKVLGDILIDPILTEEDKLLNMYFRIIIENDAKLLPFFYTELCMLRGSDYKDERFGWAKKQLDQMFQLPPPSQITSLSQLLRTSVELEVKDAVLKVLLKVDTKKINPTDINALCESFQNFPSFNHLLSKLLNGSKFTRETTIDEISNAISNSEIDENTRSALLRAISVFAQTDQFPVEKVVSLCLQSLTDVSAEVRKAAADCLSEVRGEGEQNVMDSLRKSLAIETIPKVRIALASSLLRLRNNEQEALSALQSLIKDNSLATKEDRLYALERFLEQCPDDKLTITVAVKCLESHHSSVRSRVLLFLSNLNMSSRKDFKEFEKEVKEGINYALETENENLADAKSERNYALRLISSMGADGKFFLPNLALAYATCRSEERPNYKAAISKVSTSLASTKSDQDGQVADQLIELARESSNPKVKFMVAKILVETGWKEAFCKLEGALILSSSITQMNDDILKQDALDCIIENHQKLLSLNEEQDQVLELFNLLPTIIGNPLEELLARRKAIRALNGLEAEQRNLLEEDQVIEALVIALKPGDSFWGQLEQQETDLSYDAAMLLRQIGIKARPQALQPLIELFGELNAEYIEGNGSTEFRWNCFYGYGRAISAITPMESKQAVSAFEDWLEAGAIFEREMFIQRSFIVEQLLSKGDIGYQRFRWKLNQLSSRDATVLLGDIFSLSTENTKFEEVLKRLSVDSELKDELKKEVKKHLMEKQKKG